MTAVGYISDNEEIIKASWWNFQHDGAAAFELSERSLLPPALSAKDLAGGPTQVFVVHQIERINRHPAKSDEDRAPRSISNTKNWLDLNWDLDNPVTNDDDWEEDNESNIKLDNAIEAADSPEHRDVTFSPNVTG